MKIYAAALITTTVLSVASMNAGFRPLSAFQSFSEDEVASYINNELTTAHLTTPNEATTFILNQLKNERVSGLCIAIEPRISQLFIGQQFPFEIMYKDEMGKVQRKKYGLSLDWKMLNAPLAYSLIVITISDTERDFFTAEDPIELKDGIRYTFPLPDQSLSLTEIRSHFNGKLGKLNVWCLSLGKEGVSNLMKNGELAPLR